MSFHNIKENDKQSKKTMKVITDMKVLEKVLDVNDFKI